MAQGNKNEGWLVGIGFVLLMFIVNSFLFDFLGVSDMLMSGASSANPWLITWCIRLGANVNETDDNGVTPLMFAAQDNPNPEVSRILIEKGANINAIYKKNGWTPLMFAARFNSAEVLQIFLDKGADVTIKNNDGYSALDYADVNEKLKGTTAYKLLREKASSERKYRK